MKDKSPRIAMAVRLPEEARAKLMKLAEKEKRSQSNQLEVLIDRGYEMAFGQAPVVVAD